MVGIGLGLMIGFAVIGAAIGNALVVSTTMKSITRQPELSGKLTSTMFIGMAFIDGIAVIALFVFGFLMLQKV